MLTSAGWRRVRSFPILLLTLLSFSTEGESPLLYRSGARPSEEDDHVYDPVKSPVDVVADHHAGIA
jgi:hypothetical protein